VEGWRVCGFWVGFEGGELMMGFGDWALGRLNPCLVSRHGTKRNEKHPATQSIYSKPLKNYIK